MQKRIPVGETIDFLGKKIKICGWINKIRSHGKIIFFDLRDGSGILQIVFTPENRKIYDLAKKTKTEWITEIEGVVSERPKRMENPKIETGKIELNAEDLKIISEAKTLPFPIDTPGYEIDEEIRLKYRYLDLRRERLRMNLEKRQKAIQFMRTFLQEEGFVEVETPLLTKSTPEGARDFLVPSRLYPGKFYALPQSPQQYKQLLMVAGLEKYFQIARCLRDEDPRADRQPEHTQLDIEMSFIEEEDVLNLTEKLYIDLVNKLFPEKKITKIPFPRMTYKDAVEKYKADKPDLREDKNNPDELSFSFITHFPMFEYHQKEKRWGAMHHPFTLPFALPAFDDQGGGDWSSEKINQFKKNPEKIMAHQYDLSLNGFEIGGGSIRNINLDLLTAVFEVLGHKKDEIKKNFAHYFEAFGYGVPPHGGIALGVDRFLAILFQEPNIREVIAFPKTGDNRDLMMDVPAEVSKEQLKELHINAVYGSKKEAGENEK
jgi:aspartyl-tRNA synthetase